MIKKNKMDFRQLYDCESEFKFPLTVSMKKIHFTTLLGRLNEKNVMFQVHTTHSGSTITT